MLNFHQFCCEIIFNAYFHQNINCVLLLAFLTELSIFCLEYDASRKWLYSFFIIKWIYIWIWMKLYVKNHIYAFIYKLHGVWKMNIGREGFFFLQRKKLLYENFVSDWNDSSKVFSVPLVNNDMLTKWHFCYCYWNKHRHYKLSIHWKALRSSLVFIFSSTGFCDHLKTWWPTVKWHLF